MKRETKDELMDQLLREDARAGADEAFLADLDKTLEAASEDENEKSNARDRRKGIGLGWKFAAAAAVMVGGYGAVLSTGNESDHERVLASEEFVDSGNLKSSLPSEETNLNLGTSPVIPASDPVELAPLDPVALAIQPMPVSPPLPGVVPAAPPTNLGTVRFRLHQLEGLNTKLQAQGLGTGQTAKGLQQEIEALRKQIGGFDQPGQDRERYGQLVDQPWKKPGQNPLSTFSVDVDTASYSNIRRLLNQGAGVPKDAVRTEECLNYFDYQYEAPKDGPFAVHVDMMSCPWNMRHHLVKIGLKGQEVERKNRPPSNLVFLIDVSGSMKGSNKLPLLIESMKILVEELDDRDSVGIVVYASAAGTVLEPTKVAGNGRTEILSALDNLQAGGSTAGAAGLRGAYELAQQNKIEGGVNRVILATDGDFNVGVSADGALVDLVKERAQNGVFLSVLGFGGGNINDQMLEGITNEGNGNYFYIDTLREGRKVFLQNLSGTLVTIAKDVKIQVEFNPAKVGAYRLIGYANRILPPEAFNDDEVDAGDIGAGHTVTAIYEIVPRGVALPQIGEVDPLKYQEPDPREVGKSKEWMTVKLRYKAPEGTKSNLLEIPVSNKPTPWEQANGDFQFAAGVALFGEKLRDSKMINDAEWTLVDELARRGSGRDPHGHRAEFRQMVQRLLQPPPVGVPEPQPLPIDPPPAVEAPALKYHD